jgi:hypothetical protein
MTCPTCGAALADDQRYCLNCGQRQGGPRVDFRQHLEAKDAVANPPTPPTGVAGAPGGVPSEPPPQKPQRDYAPLAAAGGIAVLGIMLLIGVLIGRGTDDSNDSSAAPQVVTVGAAPAASGANDEGAGSGGSRRGEKKGSNGKAAKRKNAASSSKTDTGNAPVASEQQLKALQGKTGQEYAEESAKLPDEIATPGEAPPPDNKAPGGGSGGVTLE